MDLFLIFFNRQETLKNRHFINIRYQVSNDYKRVNLKSKKSTKMSKYIVSPNKPIVTLAEVESPVIEKIVASFPIEH